MSDDPAADVGQATLFQNGVNPLPGATPSQAFDPGSKFQVFADAHVRMQGIVFGHVTDAAPDFIGFAEDVQARDSHGAGSPRHEARKNPHGGAFSSAIW